MQLIWIILFCFFNFSSASNVLSNPSARALSRELLSKRRSKVISRNVFFDTKREVSIDPFSWGVFLSITLNVGIFYLATEFDRRYCSKIQNPNPEVLKSRQETVSKFDLTDFNFKSLLNNHYVKRILSEIAEAQGCKVCQKCESVGDHFTHEHADKRN